MALLTASTQQAANVAALKNMVGADFSQANLTLDNAAGTASYQQDQYTQLVASAGGDISTVVDEEMLASHNRTKAYEAAAAALKALEASKPPKRTRDDGFGYGTWNKDVWPTRVAEWQARVDAARAQLAVMPSFAVGINSVPYDTLAQVHAGEEIKPAPYVDMERAERTESTRSMRSMVAELAGLRNEVSQLRTEAQSERVALVGTSQRTERILDKWDHIGMPEVQTA
jgi:hypothetical protein